MRISSTPGGSGGRVLRPHGRRPSVLAPGPVHAASRRGCASRPARRQRGARTQRSPSEAFEEPAARHRHYVLSRLATTGRVRNRADSTPGGVNDARNRISGSRTHAATGRNRQPLRTRADWSAKRYRQRQINFGPSLTRSGRKCREGIDTDHQRRAWIDGRRQHESAGM